MKLYIGTSGFSYAPWKGKFYPKDIHSNEMLSYYAERFNSVEINNTFFRMPQASTLKTWLSDVASGFRFSFKAPGRITHRRRLKNSEEITAKFLKDVALMRKCLGAILFQLPPNFKKDISRLEDFLAVLPKKYRFAFEFRHESWFEDSVFERLHSVNAALCIAESEDTPKTPFVATADWGYLRLRRLDYTRARLKARSQKILSQGWSDAFIYFRHEEMALGPSFAKVFEALTS